MNPIRLDTAVVPAVRAWFARWPSWATGAIALGLVVGACSAGDSGSTAPMATTTPITADAPSEATPAADGGAAPTPTATPRPTEPAEPTETPPAAPTAPPVPTISALPADLAPAPTPPAGLRELVAGHNRLDADRINLVVAGWGWDDPEAFADMASLFVAWDGHAQRFDDQGRPDPQGGGAAFGIFSVDPFRSNRHLFNVWLTDVVPEMPAAWLNSDDEPFDLPDQVLITLALDPERAVPGITSVAVQDTAFFLPDHDGTAIERSSSDPFGNVLVRVDSGFPAGTALDAPHELGHAMFGLADEYVGRNGGDGVVRQDTWPSCAAPRESAEDWWGDLVGDVDPMIDIYIAELVAIGQVLTDADARYFRNQVRVGFVEGGCFGDPGSYRPGEDTLMGFNLPAFGSVNRRWAEQILALWTGAVSVGG